MGPPRRQILGVTVKRRPLIRSLQAHNRLVVGLRPASPTTQSHANPVSCGLWKNLRISAPFARFEPALPVSAAGEGRPTRQKCRPVSGSRKLFPASAKDGKVTAWSGARL
jgi:hypothetical protein